MEIHSCSYFCTRPGCVLAQRTELREEAAKMRRFWWDANADLRDALTENIGLRAQVAALEQDAKRYRWLRERLLVFEVPRDMQISGNLDKSIDEAMQD